MSCGPPNHGLNVDHNMVYMTVYINHYRANRDHGLIQVLGCLIVNSLFFFCDVVQVEIVWLAKHIRLHKGIGRDAASAIERGSSSCYYSAHYYNKHLQGTIPWLDRRHQVLSLSLK